MNDFLETIKEELRHDNRLKSVVSFGPWTRTPNRRGQDIKSYYLEIFTNKPTSPEEKRWLECYSIIVAPAIGRYSQPLLQELLEGLLPNRKPAEITKFAVDETEGRLNYGSKTFAEKVGEEVTTIETRLEQRKDLKFFKTETKRILTPIYQTVSVMLCPDYSLAIEASRLRDLGVILPSPFSIDLKDLEKRDPKYRPGLMERLFR